MRQPHGFTGFHSTKVHKFHAHYSEAAHCLFWMGCYAQAKAESYRIGLEKSSDTQVKSYQSYKKSKCIKVQVTKK